MAVTIAPGETLRSSSSRTRFPPLARPMSCADPRRQPTGNRPNRRIEAFKRMLEFLRELSRRDADARRMLTPSADLKGLVRMA